MRYPPPDRPRQRARRGALGAIPQPRASDARPLGRRASVSLPGRRRVRRLTRRGLASLLTCPGGEPEAWEQRGYKYETGRTHPPLHAAWLLTGALDISLHALCEPRLDRARIHDVIVRLPPDRLPAALAAVRSLLD